MNKSDIIQGEVSALAFGGQGIIRHEGFVIFVPYTAIGDQVTCRILKKKKSYGVGELIHIDTPSPQRVTPPCPYFGKCGGCQIQHLSYEAQLEHKRQSVQDALNRLGHLNMDVPVTIVSAVEQWAYRRHVQLTLRPSKGHFIAGYIQNDHHSLIAISHCLIFTSQENPIIKQVQELCSELVAGPSNDGRVTILKHDENDYFLAFHFKEFPPNSEKLIREAMKKWETWKAVSLGSPKHSFVYGDPKARIKIGDLTISFSPHAFIQNHPEQSVNIYNAFSKMITMPNSRKVLDLYCGIGISSLMLAKLGLQVVGIENNEEAIRLAEQNAKDNDINTARFILSDAGAVADEMLAKLCPDAIIVNPPRTGLDPKVTAALIRHPVKQVIYISCMPSTLARDLSILNEKGQYAIKSCTAFDMFPQTGHVETVIELVNKSSQ